MKIQSQFFKKKSPFSLNVPLDECHIAQNQIGTDQLHDYQWVLFQLGPFSPQRF